MSWKDTQVTVNRVLSNLSHMGQSFSKPIAGLSRLARAMWPRQDSDRFQALCSMMGKLLVVWLLTKGLAILGRPLSPGEGRQSPLGSVPEISIQLSVGWDTFSLSHHLLAVSSC